MSREATGTESTNRVEKLGELVADLVVLLLPPCGVRGVLEVGELAPPAAVGVQHQRVAAGQLTDPPGVPVVAGSTRSGKRSPGRRVRAAGCPVSVVVTAAPGCRCCADGRCQLSGQARAT